MASASASFIEPESWLPISAYVGAPPVLVIALPMAIDSGVVATFGTFQTMMLAAPADLSAATFADTSVENCAEALAIAADIDGMSAGVIALPLPAMSPAIPLGPKASRASLLPPVNTY